ncbi:hypothetical protein BpHYR1_031183 [Brachionus plicatilis]|uniref:CCHC-type domain-containing protein n=1 Tax=Brachionus plicatilis TaxID=10195 RepID=A0A3M7R0S0_BRAPC|nr:hypothetical protein BpHYR1_031183 [Brachionus plicatilis]
MSTMSFFSLPISMEYCESLPVQALVHMVKAQNHLETDFHYLEENGTLVNGSEVEQADWLEKITATKAPKKLLISLLTQKAVLVAKKKEQPDASHHNKSTPQSSLSTTMESTHQQQQIIEPDMSPMENRLFNRRPQFKMDDIPKLYGNDKDKIEEWIYLVETEAEDQGIDKNRLVTAVNKFLRGNALQLVRNLKKKKENLTWVELKSHLLASYKPDDVQRTLRSELKAIKLDVNYKENVLKFQQIANKIEKIDEFELVWMFFDAVDPRVRAELESKNGKTLDDSKTQARIFSRSTWSVNKPVPVYYSRNNYKKGLNSFYNLREKEVDRGKNLNNKTDDIGKIPVCYRCKKPGHIKADCKVKLFSGENNNNSYYGRNQNKGKWSNPKKSYLAEETEEPESNNLNLDTEYVYVCTTGNLLRINGLVDGKPVKFAIDSGCTSSIISRKTVNNFGLRILPSSSKIKTADNTISMVVGKTEKIKLDIQGHVCFMEFLIKDHEDNDGLLGLDGLCKQVLVLILVKY